MASLFDHLTSRLSTSSSALPGLTRPDAAAGGRADGDGGQPDVTSAPAHGGEIGRASCRERVLRLV